MNVCIQIKMMKSSAPLFYYLVQRWGLSAQMFPDPPVIGVVVDPEGFLGKTLKNPFDRRFLFAPGRHQNCSSISFCNCSISLRTDVTRSIGRPRRLALSMIWSTFARM